jgi:hypothetical protein
MNLKLGPVPIIKENRWDRIVQVLAIFDLAPYNRERQRALILDLYPGKKEKSVFRGMVIPTLRRLGLILGRGSTIRLSANGRLVVLAKRRNEKELSRVSRVIVQEIDADKYRFLDALNILASQRGSVGENEFVQELASTLSKLLPLGRARERVRRWRDLLLGVGLFVKEKSNLLVNVEALKAVMQERNLMNNSSLFEECFLKGYRMVALQVGSPVVDIAAIRERAASLVYEEHGRVLTEGQFDELLVKLVSIPHKYAISMGRPGALREKSFKYRNNFYRTIAIVFHEVNS